MKKFVVVFIELVWYSLDIDDMNNFATSIEYQSKDTVITFQTSDLIRDLNSKEKVLPIIIDLESLDIQMSQEGKDLRNYQFWKLLNRLKHHKIIDSGFQLKKENIKLFLEHIAILYYN
ncbi:hypothetical protein [Niastella sp. OAS944]|uniref:hypothetical protein n=1 Tax=Niastella sp. OAS944 TaxID=2664089 RepID=UPI00349728F8|nr:hypothetical protein [Chitinophagaceae bacterium OAS944]